VLRGCCRSASLLRGFVLGFFLVVAGAVPAVVSVGPRVDIAPLVFHAALFHRCPIGPAVAAQSIARTIVRLAARGPRCRLLGIRARASADTCTATSSMRVATTKVVHGPPRAVTASTSPFAGGGLWSRFPQRPLTAGLRLSAQVLGVVDCVFAHCRASSQSRGGQEIFAGRRRLRRKQATMEDSEAGSRGVEDARRSAQAPEGIKRRNGGLVSKEACSPS
jgi:hypothetical protein